MAAKYDEATGYKLCKRGHVRSPQNVNNQGSCKECVKARNRGTEYRAYQKEYRKTPEFKAYNKAYQQAYRRTPAGKASAKAYRQTPKHKARQQAYQQTPECKAYQQTYQQTPKCKAHQKAYESYNSRQLTDRYIADQLGITTKQATPELLELKRLSLQLHRSLKCQKQNSL